MIRFAWLSRLTHLLNKIGVWFRDKRRGYTDADLESMRKKYAEYQPIPGGVVQVTEAEFKAIFDKGRPA